MFLGGIEVHLFASVHLIVQAKFGDNPLKGHLLLTVFVFLNIFKMLPSFLSLYIFEVFYCYMTKRFFYYPAI